MVDGKDYVILSFPEYQKFMDLEGWEDNSSLLTPNPVMGIGHYEYLVNKEWFNLVS